MPEGREAAVGADREAVGVTDGVAAGEDAAAGHGFDEPAAADLGRLVVAHPEDEIVDTRVEGRGGECGELVGLAAEGGGFGLHRRIRFRPPRHHLQVIVGEVRAVHAEGREDARMGVFAEGHPGLHLYHAREQVVAPCSSTHTRSRARKLIACWLCSIRRIFSKEMTSVNSTPPSAMVWGQSRMPLV